MTPKERIAQKNAIADTPRKPKKYAWRDGYVRPQKGQVRIALYQNMPWHGFTLQRGHLYGMDQNGVLFVSANQYNENGLIVYRQGRNQWHKTTMPAKSTLAEEIAKAAEKRKQIGIDRVEFASIASDCKHGRIKPPTSRKECWCYHK